MAQLVPSVGGTHNAFAFAEQGIKLAAERPPGAEAQELTKGLKRSA